MQKRIIIILICFFPLLGNAQNFVEDFVDVPSLYLNGWFQVNNSSPMGTGTWEQDFGNFDAPFGPDNSSIVVGYTSIVAGQSGDISNWLITPTINCTEGDSIIFYTRSFQNAAYPDRLELRLNRTNTIDVGISITSVGDFDTTLLTINPTLTISTGGYPMIWTRYAVMIEGISPSTPCRIGLRYFVTDGGQAGVNSSTIGIDHFEYKSVFTGIENETPLQAFVSMSNGQIGVQVPQATHSFMVDLLDITGKTISMGAYDQEAWIDSRQFSQGVYLIKIVYEGKYLIKKISF